MNEIYSRAAVAKERALDALTDPRWIARLIEVEAIHVAKAPAYVEEIVSMFVDVPVYACNSDGVALLDVAADSYPADDKPFQRPPVSKHGLIYFDKPLSVPESSAPLNALFWFADKAEEWSVLMFPLVFKETGGFMAQLVSAPIRPNSTVSDIEQEAWSRLEPFDDQPEDAGRLFFSTVLRTFFTFNLLSTQRVLVESVGHPQRGIRRRHERKGWISNVVQITLPGRQHSNTTSTSHDIDWSHRWMVRGHWRQQYYPSDQSHRPVWIAPYVKGPDDKPFIAKERQYIFDGGVAHS